MDKGVFITFEGGEGSGKTTQINRLAESLTHKGYKVITTREPGGTPEAEKIRDFLVQREGGDWSPMAECLLLFAAREMHYNRIIKPALDEGKIVICDRFTDSTRAYQGYGHDLDLNKIEQLKLISLGDVEADITYILDIDCKEGLARSGRRLSATQINNEAQREDRFENLDTSFHERLRQGFLDIAKNAPQRCHVIDASQPLDDVEQDIFEIMLTKLGG
ncbi:MAG: dTMP kinase [Micavibrio sp.]|nr:dTMP kinase [Micavibrio sp.]